MEPQTMVDPGKPVDGKSALQSKSLALGVITLAGGLIAKFNPAVGDWIKANADSILSLIGILAVSARSTTSEKIDFRNWTIGGVGIKF